MWRLASASGVAELLALFQDRDTAHRCGLVTCCLNLSTFGRNRDLDKNSEHNRDRSPDFSSWDWEIAVASCVPFNTGHLMRNKL